MEKPALKVSRSVADASEFDDRLASVRATDAAAARFYGAAPVPAPDARAFVRDALAAVTPETLADDAALKGGMNAVLRRLFRDSPAWARAFGPRQADMTGRDLHDRLSRWAAGGDADALKSDELREWEAADDAGKDAIIERGDTPFFSGALRRFRDSDAAAGMKGELPQAVAAEIRAGGDVRPLPAGTMLPKEAAERRASLERGEEPSAGARTFEGAREEAARTLPAAGAEESAAERRRRHGARLEMRSLLYWMQENSFAWLSDGAKDAVFAAAASGDLSEAAYFSIPAAERPTALAAVAALRGETAPFHFGAGETETWGVIRREAEKGAAKPLADRTLKEHLAVVSHDAARVAWGAVKLLPELAVDAARAGYDAGAAAVAEALGGDARGDVYADIARRHETRAALSRELPDAASGAGKVVAGFGDNLGFAGVAAIGRAGAAYGARGVAAAARMTAAELAEAAAKTAAEKAAAAAEKAAAGKAAPAAFRWAGRRLAKAAAAQRAAGEAVKEAPAAVRKQVGALRALDAAKAETAAAEKELRAAERAVRGTHLPDGMTPSPEAVRTYEKAVARAEKAARREAAVRRQANAWKEAAGETDAARAQSLWEDVADARDRCAAAARTVERLNGGARNGARAVENALWYAPFYERHVDKAVQDGAPLPVAMKSAFVSMLVCGKLEKATFTRAFQGRVAPQRLIAESWRALRGKVLEAFARGFDPASCKAAGRLFAARMATNLGHGAETAFNVTAQSVADDLAVHVKEVYDKNAGLHGLMSREAFAAAFTPDAAWVETCADTLDRSVPSFFGFALLSPAQMRYGAWRRTEAARARNAAAFGDDARTARPWEGVSAHLDEGLLAAHANVERAVAAADAYWAAEAAARLDRAQRGAEGLPQGAELDALRRRRDKAARDAEGKRKGSNRARRAQEKAADLARRTDEAEGAARELAAAKEGLTQESVMDRTARTLQAVFDLAHADGGASPRTVENVMRLTGVDRATAEVLLSAANDRALLADATREARAMYDAIDRDLAVRSPEALRAAIAAGTVPGAGAARAVEGGVEFTLDLGGGVTRTFGVTTDPAASKSALAAALRDGSPLGVDYDALIDRDGARTDVFRDADGVPRRWAALSEDERLEFAQRRMAGASMRGGAVYAVGGDGARETIPVDDLVTLVRGNADTFTLRHETAHSLYRLARDAGYVTPENEASFAHVLSIDTESAAARELIDDGGGRTVERWRVQVQEAMADGYADFTAGLAVPSSPRLVRAFRDATAAVRTAAARGAKAPLFARAVNALADAVAPARPAWKRTAATTPASLDAVYRAMMLGDWAGVGAASAALTGARVRHAREKAALERKIAAEAAARRRAAAEAVREERAGKRARKIERRAAEAERRREEAERAAQEAAERERAELAARQEAELAAWMEEEEAREKQEAAERAAREKIDERSLARRKEAGSRQPPRLRWAADQTPEGHQRASRAYLLLWRAQTGRAVSAADVAFLGEEYGLPPEAVGLVRADGKDGTARWRLPKGGAASAPALSDADAGRLQDALVRFWADAASVRPVAPDVYVAAQEDVPRVRPAEIWDPVNARFVEGRVVVDPARARPFRELAGQGGTEKAEAGTVASVDTPNAAQSYAEARGILSGQVGKPLVNAESGITATISRNSIDKMLSGKAVAKSVGVKEHLAAVANVVPLFEKGVLRETEQGGRRGVSATRKFYAAFNFGGERLVAKITVLEYERKDNRVYSVEAMEVAKAESILAPEDSVNPAENPAPPLTERSLPNADGGRKGGAAETDGRTAERRPATNAALWRKRLARRAADGRAVTGRVADEEIRHSAPRRFDEAAGKARARITVSPHPDVVRAAQEAQEAARLESEALARDAETANDEALAALAEQDAAVREALAANDAAVRENLAALERHVAKTGKPKPRRANATMTDFLAAQPDGDAQFPLILWHTENGHRLFNWPDRGDELWDAVHNRQMPKSLRTVVFGMKGGKGGNDGIAQSIGLELPQFAGLSAEEILDRFLQEYEAFNEWREAGAPNAAELAAEMETGALIDRAGGPDGARRALAASADLSAVDILERHGIVTAEDAAGMREAILDADGTRDLLDAAGLMPDSALPPENPYAESEESYNEFLADIAARFSVTAGDRLDARGRFDRLKGALVANPLPAGVAVLPRAAAPQEVAGAFADNLLGRTFRLPVGGDFTFNEGHFFRLVCSGRNGRKGFVEGYASGKEAYAAVRAGEVPAEKVAGWEDGRARLVPLVPDLLSNPAAVLESGDVAQFVKRYDIGGGKTVTAVFRTFADGRKILSFHPTDFRYGEMKQYRVAYMDDATQAGTSPATAESNPRGLPRTAGSVPNGDAAAQARFSVAGRAALAGLAAAAPMQSEWRAAEAQDIRVADDARALREMAGEDGARADGTRKGLGFFGPLVAADGRIVTEFSAGFEYDGRETEVPLVNPLLDREEIAYLLRGYVTDGDPAMERIIRKGEEWGRRRLAEGRSPFLEEGEARRGLPPPTAGAAPSARYSLASTLAGGRDSTARYVDSHGKERALHVVKGDRRHGMAKVAYKHCVDYGTAWTGGFTLDELRRHERDILERGDKTFDKATGRRTFKWKSPEGVTFTVGTFVSGKGADAREVVNTVYTDRGQKETKTLGTHFGGRTRLGQPSGGDSSTSGARAQGGGARFSVAQTADGRRFALLDRPPTGVDWNDRNAVRDWLAGLVGTGAVSLADGRRVEIGGELPREYTRSNYAEKAFRNKRLRKLRGRAAQHLDELIVVSGGRVDEAARHKERAGGVYYRREVDFGVSGHEVKRGYTGELVTYEQDGTEYLYDLVGIKDNPPLTDALKRDRHGGFEILSANRDGVDGGDSTTSGGGAQGEIERMRASLSLPAAAARRLSADGLLALAASAELARTAHNRVTRAVAEARVLRDAESRLRALGEGRTDPESLRRRAEAVLREAKEGERSLRGVAARAERKTLAAALQDAQLALYRRSLAQAGREGARTGAEGEAAVSEIDRRIAAKAADEIAAQTGVAAGELEAAYGVDLAETLLRVRRLRTAAEDARRGADGEKADEDAGEEADAAPPEDFLPTEAKAAREAEIRELVAALAERAAGESARADAGRAARADAADGADADDAGEADGGADADAAGAAADDLARLALSKRLVDLENPDCFARFVAALAEEKWKREHGIADADAYVWGDPVAMQHLRMTALNVYNALARKLMHSARRETAVRKLRDIERSKGYLSCVAAMADCGRTVAAGMVRETQEEMVAEIEQQLEEAFGAKGRFRRNEENVHRKVTGETELWARDVKKVLRLSERKVADMTEEILRRKDVTKAEFEWNGRAVDSSRQFQKDVRLMSALRQFGALIHRSPGEISDARLVLLDRLAEDTAGAEAAAREERTKRAAAALARAFDTGREDAYDERTFGAAVSRYLTAHLDFKHLLLDLARFCGDGEARAAAEEFIGNLQHEIQRRTDAAATERRRHLTAFRDAVRRIYGRDPWAVIADLNRHDARFDRFGRGEVDEATGRATRVRMSRARAMQLYVSLQQKGYIGNVVANGRQGQAQEIRALLSAQDLMLLKWMGDWYERERAAVSAVSERLFGVPVLAEEANYFPVKPLLPTQGPEKPKAVTWSPFPPSLTPRVRHGHDFDARVSVFDMWTKRMAEQAQWKQMAELGVELRGIFGRQSLQATVRRCHGAAAVDAVNEFITDILNGQYRDVAARGAVDAVDRARGWAALCALGGNAGVMLKQTTSVPAMALEIGVGRTLRHLATALTPEGFAAMRAIWNSDQRRNRWDSGNAEEVANALADRLPGAFKRLVAKSMVLNKIGDAVPTLLVGQGIYRELTGGGMDADEAMNRVWEIANRTQQTAQMDNQTAIQRRSSLGRAFFQFASAVRQYLSYEIADARKLAARPGDARNWVDFCRTTVLTAVVLPALYYAAGELWKAAKGREPEDGEFLDGLVASCLASPWSSFFFYGILADGLAETLATGRRPWGNSASLPALQLAENLVLSAAEAGCDLAAAAYCAMGGDVDDPPDAEDFLKSADRFLRSASAPYRDAADAVKGWGE